MGKIIWVEQKRIIFGSKISFTFYKLTETKLYTRTGWLNIRENQLDLYKILDRSKKSNFVQRLFGLGTIYLKTCDSNESEKIIKNIPNVDKVYKVLSNQVDKEKERNGVAGRDIIGTIINI